MAIDHTLMIKRFQKLEEIYAAYAVATNMPFVTCDQDTCNDQVWVFSNQDGVQEFARQYAEQKIMFKGVKILKANMPEFYADLHSMGINEVVFCSDGVQHKLALTKLVRFPDFSNQPENQRPLMNPALQLSTLYFFQQIRRPGMKPDHKELEPLAEEMYVNLAKSRFLMPVQMLPLADNKSKLSLPYITDKNGNNYQPIFSDHTQYMKHIKKHKPMEHTRVLLVGIAELQKYLLDHVQGYMLNPDGYCHVLNGKQLNLIQERFQG